MKRTNQDDVPVIVHKIEHLLGQKNFLDSFEEGEVCMSLSMTGPISCLVVNLRNV